MLYMYCSGHLQKSNSCESHREKTEHLCLHVCVCKCLYHPYLERQRDTHMYRCEWYKPVRLQPIKCNTTSSWGRQFLEMLLCGRSFLLCIYIFVIPGFLQDVASLCVALSSWMALVICPGHTACMAWLFLAAIWLRWLWVTWLIPRAE